MLEAITTAKENRDTTCLNFALNWFAHFARSHPNLIKEVADSSMLGSGKESLVFLRAKAKETGLWILWISALLSEANLSLSSGESVSAAMESMVRSSRLIVEKNARTLIGPQLSLSAGLWDRLGLTVMSTMTCEVFHRCHARSSVLDDQLKLTCRVAGLLAGKGQYDEAFAKLEGIDTNSLRSAKPDQYWRLYRGLLKLRRDLHHDNLESAEALLSQLLQHSPDDIDVEMRSTIDTLHIEALIRRHEFDAAFTKVEKLLSGLRETNTDVSKRIRLLLVKVHLLDCTGRPEKGFTLAMRAASMAWRSRLVTLLWQAIGALANILNCLGEFAGAERLLVALLPRCLETDEVHVTGTLYSLLADARIGLLGEMKAHRGSASERAKLIGKVHKTLDSAFKCFSSVEDVRKQYEVMAKKATLYKVEGDHGRADSCAEAYLGLWQEELARR
jgi:anaphase-promoting complex subunit 5